VLDRARVAELLALQAVAYRLLRWLGEACVDDPELLSANLAGPRDVGAWLERYRDRIPPDLVPEDPRGAFANLFASFFATSFHIDRLEFGDRVVFARIVLGAPHGRPDRTGLGASQALAVRHLAASEGLAVTDRQAGELVRAGRVPKDALLVWTYVWELDRRARNKGKGPVVHRIWRSIPADMRRALTADDVWAARERVLASVRGVIDAR
jgi:hypothetical protein